MLLLDTHSSKLEMLTHDYDCMWKINLDTELGLNLTDKLYIAYVEDINKHILISINEAGYAS